MHRPQRPMQIPTANDLDFETWSLQERVERFHLRERTLNSTIRQPTIDDNAVRSMLFQTQHQLREAEDNLAFQTAEAARYKAEAANAEVWVNSIAAMLAQRTGSTGRMPQRLSELSRTISDGIDDLDTTQIALSNTQAKLTDSRSSLAVAESTISSQNDKIRASQAHLKFRQRLRLRCFLTYRRDKANAELSPWEEASIIQANKHVHGGDCHFDAVYTASDSSSSYYQHYRSIYMVYPETILKHKSNKRLLDVTNKIGNVMLGERGDDNFHAFHYASQWLQATLLHVAEGGQDGDSDRWIEPLSEDCEREYQEIIAEFQVRRQTRGKKKVERSLRF